MTKKQFTVINSKVDLDTKAPEGTVVTVKHEKTNDFDKHALRVYLEHNGEELGFIGATAVATGSELNSSLYEIMDKSNQLDGFSCIVVEHQVVMIGSNRKLKRMCLVVEPLNAVEEEATDSSTSGVEFEFVVKGPTKKYRGKAAVLTSLMNGESPIVGLKMDGDNIIATYDDIQAGEVDPSSPGFDLAVKVISTLGEVTASTSNPLNATYTVKFKVDEETMTYIKTGKKVLTLQDVKDEKSKFIPKERLDAIHAYLDKSGLKSKQIMKIMGTYKEYPLEVQSRIPQQSKSFIDTFGGIRKTVTYMNKGQHLRMVGEKGTGKNLLTTVLAWVYQRPLWELSLNSQTDKLDLMGSKTFTTTVDANGKEITEIGFQKEALVEAMEVGGFLNLDEVNTADPAVLVLLHSIVDDRGTLEVPSYGRVEADENFRIILTMNADYIGTNPLNEATRDRFTPILLPNNVSIAKLLQENVKGAKASDIQLADRLYKSIINLVQQGSMSMDCITVRGFISALEVADELDLKEALEDCVANRIEDEEYRMTVTSMIDDIFG